MPFDIDGVRERFPVLQRGFIFMENAGGSQVPGLVVAHMASHMVSKYVQLGAPYELSAEATKTVEDAHTWVNRIMGGEKTGMVVLGPSSTQLAAMLAECYSRNLQPGDEIIINEAGHEANIGPWVKLERYGIKTKFWQPVNRRGETPIEDLHKLITPKTKLVCFPHVSNLLGAVLDVQAITKIAHEHGAKVVVDGVAYAPHRPMDVHAWDVDWYFYSTYKVYGPHMGALYGKHEAFAELEGPNHFFLPGNDAYKFELGGPSHEGCAGLVGLKPYISYLSGSGEEPERDDVARAFELMAQAELPLQQRLIGFLLERGAEIIGPTTAGPERVPTISFLHPNATPERIVDEVVKAGIGIRNGHMYAYRLCKWIGIDVESGVTRISLVHYNTIEEVDQLISALSKVI